MQYTRRWLIAALAATPVAGWCQPGPCAPSLGALTQRMGKAWLCTAAPELRTPAHEVLGASQAAFERQLAQAHQRANPPEQAGVLRALSSRYQDYLGLLASKPAVESHRALVSTANEVLTLTQLATGSMGDLPWQARLAARQRVLSQRVALLALASPGAESARRERQAVTFEFEAGLQTLQTAAHRDAALRERLDRAQAAWQPLREAAHAGQAAPVFMASEQMLLLLDSVTDHCARLGA